MSTTDYRGARLREGARVEAWRDGSRYTATVRTIRPHAAGDGDFRRVVLVRDDDRAEVESFSDAVSVLSAQEQDR